MNERQIEELQKLNGVRFQSLDKLITWAGLGWADCEGDTGQRIENLQDKLAPAGFVIMDWSEFDGSGFELSRYEMQK
jgi:hypothetical protein